MDSAMRYLHFCAHEQFPPQDLLRQAVAAERAGFDGIGCSDHVQPWWEPGESGNAWVWLGAAGQATGERMLLGTGVTPPGPRYHPLLIAQAWATLELMFPGRPFLGFGSGEALNEVPVGGEWPAVGAQIDRMAEALEMILALFDGQRLSGRGRHFSTDGAFLHSRPERRPPIWVSAFGPEAAKVAGRLGDGVWTLADPEAVPEIVDAYRGAAEDAGREPGEIVLQAAFSWAEEDGAALEGARVWKGAQPKEFYRDDWHDPRAMYEEGKRQVSDEELREAMIISTDLDEHAERIREVEKLGATTVALMNNSGADPLAAIDAYGCRVLPSLQGSR
ncbi:MAG TPA: TIGR03557 family F420-dependent LLM class oxidoreductase [Solirubrobacterales bacterium]